MSIASDSAVCENCGTVGRREDYVVLEESKERELFRCPRCVGERSGGASA